MGSYVSLCLICRTAELPCTRHRHRHNRNDPAQRVWSQLFLPDLVTRHAGLFPGPDRGMTSFSGERNEHICSRVVRVVDDILSCNRNRLHWFVTRAVDAHTTTL